MVGVNVLHIRRGVAVLLVVVSVTLTSWAVGAPPVSHRHKVQVSDPADRKQIADAGVLLDAGTIHQDAFAKLMLKPPG